MPSLRFGFRTIRARRAALMALACAAALGSMGRASAQGESSAAANAPRFKLHGTLLGVDGQPQSSVTVHLMGVARNNYTFGSKRMTDARGRFDYEFADASGIGKETPNGIIPGYGEYFLAVFPTEHTPGVFSPRLVLDPFTGSSMTYDPMRQINLASAITSITLRMARGSTILGRILDPEMHPLAGQTIILTYRLPVDTHTGVGGDLMSVEARSDGAGAFRFAGVTPWNVELAITPASYWIRTRVDGGEWQDDCIDRLPIEADRTTTTLDIIATDQKTFKVFGDATDAAGKPLAGVSVRVGYAMHRWGETYEDGQLSDGAFTDGHGHYEFMTATPWYRWLGAFYQGEDLIESRETIDGGHRDQPGQHEFIFRPAPAAASRQSSGSPAGGQPTVR